MPLEFLINESTSAGAEPAKSPVTLLKSFLNLMKERTTLDNFQLWIKVI